MKESIFKLSPAIVWPLAFERWNAPAKHEWEEHSVLVSRFDRMYSPADWRILELAHRKACAMLDRDPEYHPLAERVAYAVMIFFERGERDFGRLSRMAVKHELTLLKTKRLTRHQSRLSQPIASDARDHNVDRPRQTIRRLAPSPARILRRKGSTFILVMDPRSGSVGSGPVQQD